MSLPWVEILEKAGTLINQCLGKWPKGYTFDSPQPKPGCRTSKMSRGGDWSWEAVSTLRWKRMSLIRFQWKVPAYFPERSNGYSYTSANASVGQTRPDGAWNWASFTAWGYIRLLNVRTPNYTELWRRGRKPVHHQEESPENDDSKWQVEVTSFSLGGDSWGILDRK